MFLLVSKFKMIGMLLNVVHCQVQKSQRKHITKEPNRLHNHFTFITMARWMVQPGYILDLSASFSSSLATASK